MTIICLFGQRSESYPGQYAPELLAAIEETGNDNNPDYLNDKEIEYQNYGEFDFIRRMKVKIDPVAFSEVFKPSVVEITGEIKPI